MVFMIMIFLNSMVVLIGFEFNLSINTLKNLAEEAPRGPKRIDPVNKNKIKLSFKKS